MLNFPRTFLHMYRHVVYVDGHAYVYTSYDLFCYAYAYVPGYVHAYVFAYVVLRMHVCMFVCIYMRRCVY